MSKQSSDPSVEAVSRVLRLAGHLEPELEETLAEFRLSRPSFEVLAALRDAPEHRLTQRELMSAVRRTSGTMSVRLARLERARLVTREPDPDDRRGVIVGLTERGLSRIEAALPAYAEACRRLAVGLPEVSRNAVIDGLGAWLGFFDEARAGTAEGPRLGIAVAPAHVAQRMRRAVGLPERIGVLVRGVRSGGAGHTAGLAQGDLVVAADGDEVRTIGDLHRAVAHAPAGGELKLRVMRGVDERDVTVTLA
jgi:DNA-binding MarR family transcriptional regulator